MRSAPIPSALFTRNRKKLDQCLPEGAVSVMVSNPQMPRNGDQYYPYRQHSDFFYLTGIMQEGSILVLAPQRETLFIRKPDLKTAVWTGPLLSPSQASFLSGIEEVRWEDELDSLLDEVLSQASSLWLNYIPHEGTEPESFNPGARMARHLRGKFPGLKCRSIQPLIAGLRMIKEMEELEEIKKACAITHAAFLKALKVLKPGIREFEVEAQLTAEIIGRGAQGHAFEPIVASGRNALVLHHVKNNGTCRAGELLLMDFGAEVNNYAADCTRTVPVEGRFSKRQRKIYEAVLRIFKQARSLMVPGALMANFHNQVGRMWEEEHISLGLYTRKEAKQQSENEPLWNRYYVHGTSHSVGLDVHDPFERTEPFREGMVLTCEPGIYIPEEGIGIRLENDILITEDGQVDLMSGIPMEADEIESLIQKS
jgi:Xaa-Pro aminopeptidase